MTRRDALFGAYLLVVLAGAVFAVEPAAWADAVRAVGSWLYEIAKDVARGLPRPPGL